MSSVPVGPIKPGQPVGSLSSDLMGEVLLHPAQISKEACVAELIGWLRAGEDLADLYEFQRHLFGELHDVEQRWAECSRVIKRLRRGEALPRVCSELPHRGINRNWPVGSSRHSCSSGSPARFGQSKKDWPGDASIMTDG